MDTTGPVVHLINIPPTGHNLTQDHAHAGDCWCEPAHIFWVTNIHGVRVLVVEHHDFTLKPRELQLADRARGIPAALAWIDRVLIHASDYPCAPDRDIPRGPERQLPPEEKGPDACP